MTSKVSVFCFESGYWALWPNSQKEQYGKHAGEDCVRCWNRWNIWYFRFKIEELNTVNIYRWKPTPEWVQMARWFGFLIHVLQSHGVGPPQPSSSLNWIEDLLSSARSWGNREAMVKTFSCQLQKANHRHAASPTGLQPTPEFTPLHLHWEKSMQKRAKGSRVFFKVNGQNPIPRPPTPRWSE